MVQPSPKIFTSQDKAPSIKFKLSVCIGTNALNVVRRICVKFSHDDIAHGGGFFHACEDRGGRFDYSFPACAFFFFFSEDQLMHTGSTF